MRLINALRRSGIPRNENLLARAGSSIRQGGLEDRLSGLVVFSIWHCGVLDPDHVAPLRTASFIKLVKVPPNLSILELMSSLYRLWPGRVEQWRSVSHA